MQTPTEQEVSLISARVVDRRICLGADGRYFVAYNVQLETDTRGALSVWYRYDRFLSLAEKLQTQGGYDCSEIPELPIKDLLSFSEKTIKERMVKLNEFLEAATKAEYLQWGMQVDQGTLVMKRRVKTPPSRESITTDEAEDAAPMTKVLQSDCENSGQATLISAYVIDSRFTYKGGDKFAEYKVQLDTDTGGTLIVWHRYSAFCSLVTTMQTKHGHKRKEIPKLPRKELFSNFSPTTIERCLEKLNQFIEAATKAEHLKRGIRFNEDTCVYKRRVKHGSKASKGAPSSSPAPLFGMPHEFGILVVD